jgi:secretion/DNA translocation related TadE-like protein
VSGDRGQAGLWSVWACMVVLAAVMAVLGWSSALVARQRAENAADLGALAAASAQVRGEEPCGTADRVARAQGARLVRCVPEPGAVSLVVEVVAPSSLLRRLDLPPARARARAGVPSVGGCFDLDRDVRGTRGCA